MDYIATSVYIFFFLYFYLFFFIFGFHTFQSCNIYILVAADIKGPFGSGVAPYRLSRLEASGDRALPRSLLLVGLAGSPHCTVVKLVWNSPFYL